MHRLGFHLRSPGTSCFSTMYTPPSSSKTDSGQSTLDILAEDLDRFNVDQGCVDVDIMIEQYDKYLSDLLNKHAPKKNIYVVDRPLNDWMTDDILTLKAIRRKNELIWRKTRTTINFDIYYDSCKAVKKAISKSKSELMEQRVIDCENIVFSYTFSTW